MNYIWTMTISGSGMLFLYFLQKHIWRERLSKQWQYFLLKVVMAYYMIPMPLMGALYRKMIRDVFPSPPTSHFYYSHNEKIIFRFENSFALNSGYQHRLLIIGIWCFIPLIILIIQLIRYRETCKMMKRCCNTNNEMRNMAVLNRLKKTWHIKRKVTLCLCDEEHTAFTVGVKNPVIICSLPEDATEREMLLEHELVHIKRMDILWRIMGTFVKMLHWFNPLVYFFLKEFEHICEESCDEAVIKKRSKEECALYAAMLIKRSVSQKQLTGWQTALAEKKLSKSGKRILDRVQIIMDSKNRKNKWNNVLSAMVIGAMVMLNSLTALAYDEVKVLPVESEETLRSDGIIDIEIFSVQEKGKYTVTVLYDEQFMDEEGNIYQIKGNQPNAYTACKHTYQSGFYQKHEKKSGGGCTVEQYECQCCSKCGDYIMGDLIGMLSYPKCIH